MAQQMQNMIMGLQQSLVDLTNEVQQLKTKGEATATGLTTLTNTSTNAWAGIVKRLDDAGAEIENVKNKIGSGGGGGHDGGARWNLEHKGTLKEYSGDKKQYRPWAKKVMAFCNSKCDGFRKALIWAEKMQTPITDHDLQATAWPAIMTANSKL